MTVYDKAKWHDDGSFEAIGRYLDWVVHRDLVDVEAFDLELLDAMAWHEMSGTDLEGYVDGTLASEMLSPVGDAFTRDCYATYLETLAESVQGEALEAALDELFARWRAGDVERVPAPDDSEPVDLDELFAEEEAARAPAFFVDTSESHDVPEAERLLPVDLVDPPLRVESCRAGDRGDGLLDRALQRLGVSGEDAVVLTGMGGPNGVAFIAIYVVPGAPAAALRQEFRKVIYKGGGRWVERPFGGRDVVMAEGHPLGWEVVFWAIDGHVVYLAGDLPVLEPLVAKLPVGLAGGR